MADIQQDPNLVFLTSKNFDFEPVYDGAMHRDEAEEAVWFLGRQGDDGSLFLAFGDWRTNEKYIIVNGIETDDKEALAKFHHQATLDAAERAKLWVEKAGEAEAVVARSVEEPAAASPYLARKGIVTGVFLKDPEFPHAVLCPRVDFNGKVWSYERIHFSGEKEAQAGAKKAGTFCWIHHAAGEPRAVIIVEGYATGKSVVAGIGERGQGWCHVIAALGAGNLPSIARQAAKAYPNARIVIAADNDHKDKAKGNPGLAAAQKAKLLLERDNRACEIIYPKFKGFEDGTDWNDYQVARGDSALANAFVDLVSGLEGKLTEETEKAADRAEGKGKGREAAQAREMFAAMGLENVLQVGTSDNLNTRDFFKWTGTHWTTRGMGPAFVQRLHLLCTEQLGDAAKSKDVKSLSWAVATRIARPQTEEESRLFSCNLNSFNFADGTVDVVQESGSGRFVTRFRPHAKEDLFSYVHQWNWNAPNDLPRDGTFQKYLEMRRADGGDEQVRAIKQLLGACLLPYFPRFFFLLGESDSGKSTLALLCWKLAGDDNVSNLPPNRWRDFETFSMAGKLVNIDTDLPTDSAIKDDVMKKVRDKSPMFMNRKGRDLVKATLPPLHIFCTNTMPRTMEGNTGALDKRISILRFRRQELPEGFPSQNLASYIWVRDAGGVLDAAMEGVKDILESNGDYFVPSQSRAEVQDWQEENGNDVAKWLAEIRDGESVNMGGMKAVARAGALALGADLHTVFLTWAKENNVRTTPTKRTFYKLIGAAKIEKRTHEKGVAFVGLFVEGGQLPNPAMMQV